MAIFPYQISAGKSSSEKEIQGRMVYRNRDEAIGVAKISTLILGNAEKNREWQS